MGTDKHTDTASRLLKRLADVADKERSPHKRSRLAEMTTCSESNTLPTDSRDITHVSPCVTGKGRGMDGNQAQVGDVFNSILLVGISCGC